MVDVRESDEVGPVCPLDGACWITEVADTGTVGGGGGGGGGWGGSDGYAQ